MRRAVSDIDRWVQAGGRTAVTLALLAIMILLALGILVRAFPRFSLAGYDEIVELLMAWMTFLGAALLWGEGSLYRVDVLADRLPPRPAWAVALFVRLAMLLLAVLEPPRWNGEEPPGGAAREAGASAAARGARRHVPS
jgi:TRAP-type C4-dicarboxylate transport system permease small subunit